MEQGFLAFALVGMGVVPSLTCLKTKHKDAALVTLFATLVLIKAVL